MDLLCRTCMKKKRRNSQLLYMRCLPGWIPAVHAALVDTQTSAYELRFCVFSRTLTRCFRFYTMIVLVRRTKARTRTLCRHMCVCSKNLSRTAHKRKRFEQSSEEFRSWTCRRGEPVFRTWYFLPENGNRKYFRKYYPFDISQRSEGMRMG